MTLRPVEDGEWFAPRHRGYLLQCCQCSLVHRVDFRIRGRAVQMRARRLTRAQARLHVKEMRYGTGERRAGL